MDQRILDGDDEESNLQQINNIVRAFNYSLEDDYSDVRKYGHYVRYIEVVRDGYSTFYRLANGSHFKFSNSKWGN